MFSLNIIPYLLLKGDIESCHKKFVKSFDQSAVADVCFNPTHILYVRENIAREL